MPRFVNKFINKFEVDLGDSKKNERFYNSLVQLVSILFAVVFGVALSQLGKVKFLSYDFFVLCLGYFAVILSWWGYHYGIIKGPKETNILNYSIDCLLLVNYWLIMNIRSPLWIVLVWYMAMFFLYFLWESIRSCKENISSSDETIIKNAKLANFIFLILISILFFKYFLWQWAQGIYILALFVLMGVYRYIIHRVYSPKEKPSYLAQTQKDDLEKVLIEKAQIAATRARVHLSGFAVGAAILSDTGKIYSGCNIEFDNYSNTIHAEESAISGFMVAGEKKPVSIAIFASSDTMSFPCGMCRQSLFELGGEDLRVIACNNKGYEIKTMKELLPNGFHL